MAIADVLAWLTMSAGWRCCLLPGAGGVFVMWPSKTSSVLAWKVGFDGVLLLMASLASSLELLLDVACEPPPASGGKRMPSPM